MPTELISPETQQDNFTLSFLRWLDLNFTKDSTDQYCPITEVPTRKARLPLYTAEELLAQFRKEQIAPLPTLGDVQASDNIFTIAEKLFSLLTQSARQKMALMNGYDKILVLPNLAQEIRAIIKDTFDQL